MNHANEYDPADRIAAFAGLCVAVLVAAVATVPAQWFIAVTMLGVLIMPAVLLVEPALKLRHKEADLPQS